MGAEIDSLEIKLQANAQSVNRSLDSLVKKLEVLSNSLGRVNGNSLVSLSNGVQRLANSMQIMKSVGTADFTRLAKNIEKLGSLDAASLGRAASSLHRFTNALMQLDAVNVSDNAAQIGVLANGIKQLGYKSATQAIENIPKLATAMKQLMATLSTAPRVSQNIVDMTNALAGLARTGASSGRAATSLGRVLDTYTTSTGRASKGTFSLASAIGKLYATYWLLFRAFGKIGEAIDISSDLTEVQNVVDVTFGDMAYKVEDLAQTSIEQFGMSELALKQYASRFQAMGSAMGINSKLIGNANEYLNKQTNGYIALSDSMADVSLNLTKLTADMASFYNMEQKDVAEDLESIFTGQTRPLRTYGLDLTQATLQEWAMKQGLDADIQSMSQVEKTMLRYQYVLANTVAAQGDFARTADTWANQTRILKQNFEQLASVIGGVFINALKPLVKALNTAMSHIIAFAETISNALGKIFGWKYESGGGGMATDFGDAADSTDDIAGATGQAAKNIDKMKAGLRAFDELKTITLNEDLPGSGGSGSGSGGSSGSGASGGQWAEQESIFDTFKSDIDSLYELGEYIGKTLTDAMNGINWNSVYQSAKDFGKGLADFLNGLISPELFGAVGRTIAGALNTVIYAALSFGETFDWADFGLSIATGINEFFKTFDFKALAQTINVWAKGLLDAIISALESTDWKMIGTKIGEFLETLDFTEIGSKIGIALWDAIKAGIDIWKGMFNAVPIETAILTAVAVLKFTGLGSLILGKIGSTIVTALGAESGTSIGVALLGWIGKGVDSVVTKLGLVFEGLFTGMNLSEALASAFGGSSSVISAVGTSIAGIASIISGVVIAVKNFFDMWNDGWSVLGEILKDIGIALTAVGAVILGVAAAPAAIVAAVVAAVSTIAIVVRDNWDAICEWFSGAAEWFDTNVITPIADFFKGLWEDVSGFFSDLWKDVSSIWSTVSGWFSENVIEPVVVFFQGLWTRVKQIFEGLWIIAQAVWITASGWFNDNVIVPVVTFFQGLYKDVSGFFSQLWTDIQTVWSVVSDWFNKKIIIPVKNYFKGLWTDVKKYFKNLWTDIQTVWSEVSSWFDTKIITPVKSSFEIACKAIGGFFDNLWSGIKIGVVGAMNAVIGGIESAINFIVGGINDIIGGFNKIVSWAAKVAEVDWGGVDLVPTVTIPRIQAYAVGGFPEDGLFYANHSELVGKFSNGRTAVANNEQITQGIADAVYPAVYNAVSAAMRNNEGSQNVTFRVEGDPNGLFKVVRKQANEYTGRTGRPAFDF